MSDLRDKDSFLKLVQENEKIIFKICHSYCTNKNDREDLAQEMIFQLWKSFNTYNPEFKFSTWMYRVALNVAISFYRKEKSSSHIVAFQEQLVEVEDSAEDSGETEENIDLLNRFIREFKKLDRALILLYLEDKSYQEIAGILGITETNVATKLSRIKIKLKEKFITVKK